MMSLNAEPHELQLGFARAVLSGPSSCRFLGLRLLYLDTGSMSDADLLVCMFHVSSTITPIAQSRTSTGTRDEGPQQTCSLAVCLHPQTGRVCSLESWRGSVATLSKHELYSTNVQPLHCTRVSKEEISGRSIP